jgi:hypothetical protein
LPDAEVGEGAGSPETLLSSKLKDPDLNAPYLLKCVGFSASPKSII